MRLSVVVALALVLSSCDLGEVGPGTGGSGDPGGGGAARIHPEGFAAAAAHGPELLLGVQDCRACHGTDLTGGTGPSCDTCHTPQEPQAWRSDCTYCHGGADSDSGAPPRDLDGEGDSRFGAHAAHVGTSLAAAVDCVECHQQPAELLDPGHMFDDTPAIAEVVFTAGRSPDGSFADGQCSNLYCHGDGRQNGAVAAGAPAMTCSGCHGAPPGSGDHGDHGGEGCIECHQDTAGAGETIADPARHIDGLRQVAIAEPGLTVTVNGAEIRCSGPCHGRDHENDLW